MELNLRQANRLAALFEEDKVLRSMLTDFIGKFTQMIHAENLDPRTVKFEVMVPKGEPNKLVVVLRQGFYLEEPLKEAPENKESPSYQFVRVLRSLYASVIADNGRLQGFLDCCFGLCDCIFSICAYVLERNRPIHGYSIDCGDNVAGDLVFYVVMQD